MLSHFGWPVLVAGSADLHMRMESYWRRQTVVWHVIQCTAKEVNAAYVF